MNYNYSYCNQCEKPKCPERNCAEQCNCTTPSFENLGCVPIDLKCIKITKDYTCLNLKKGDNFETVLDKLESLSCLSNESNCQCNMVSNLAVEFDQRGLNDSALYRVRLLWQPVLTATSYSIEYKPSTSLNWTPLINTSLTSYNGLVINSDIRDYDFRIKVNCLNCNSDWFYKNNQSTVPCGAPTNAYYDAVNNALVWTSSPNKPSNSFSVEMRRDDQTTFTTIIVNAVETPAASGIYIASLNTVPMSADYVYHFCISNECGATQNVYSDHGSGCAFDCVVPVQSNVTVSNITGTSAVLNWPDIIGINGYMIIHVHNNVTYSNFVTESTFTLTSLNTTIPTVATVYPACSKGTYNSQCGGKTITF